MDRHCERESTDGASGNRPIAADATAAVIEGAPAVNGLCAAERPVRWHVTDHLRPPMLLPLSSVTLALCC